MISRPFSSASLMDRSESTIKQSRYSLREVHFAERRKVTSSALGENPTTEVSQTECHEGRTKTDHDGVDHVEVHVRSVGERRAHPLVDVDQRVEQDEGL